MIGNLTADFIKGRAFFALDPIVQRGVLLHRGIDRHTDSHPVFLRSTARLRPRWRHFAPVLVDVFYDHCLAIDWQKHHPAPLREWLDGRYVVLRAHRHLVHEQALWVFDRVLADDRMMRYSHLAGVRESIERMASRLAKPLPLGDAVDDLEQHREDFRADFAEFYPTAVARAEALRRTL